MPPRYTPCPDPDCPGLVDRSTGDCPKGHAKAKRRAAQVHTDAQRPNARQRGYDRTHERTFRRPVLHRDPWCVLCLEQGQHTPSVHADHHPHTRTQLVAMGENPNDPKWGRGLCASHHASETARHDGGYGNPQATA